MRTHTSSILTTLLLAGLALPGAAAAQSTGGASPSDPPPAKSSNRTAKLRPVVEQITCRTSCRGIVHARTNSTVRIGGEALDTAAAVVFLGRRGSRDDKTVPVKVLSDQAIEVTVPRRARSGPVRVISYNGLRSLASRRTITLSKPRGRRPAVEMRNDARTVLMGGDGDAGLSFFIRRSTAVAVDVVRAKDGALVAHWDVPKAGARSVQSVVWDGTIAGEPAPEGRYAWRVTPATGNARSASVAAPGPAFFLVSHRFPVVGPHTYGDGLGAGRGHQGADVFARCGTPLVATIAGKVKHVDTHERAGNYVIITGDDGLDHVYMHLRQPSPLRKGQRVATGDPVGSVGQTGRASGCHLHFELWSSPGWYTGGSVIDPVPHLRAWDGRS